MWLPQLCRDLALVPPEVLALAEHEAKRGGETLLHLLVKQGLVDDELIARALAVKLKVDRVDLDSRLVDKRIATIVPGVIGYRFRVVPLGVRRTREGDVLYVAMSTPDDDLALMELEATTGMRVVPLVASDSAIERALLRSYGPEVKVPTGRALVLTPALATGQRLVDMPVVLGEIVNDEEDEVTDPATDPRRHRAPQRVSGEDEWLTSSTKEVLALHAPAMLAADTLRTDSDDLEWLKERKSSSSSGDMPHVGATAVVSNDIGLRHWLKERLARAIPEIHDFLDVGECVDLLRRGAVGNLLLVHPTRDPRLASFLAALRDLPARPRVVVVSPDRGFERTAGVDDYLAPPADDEFLAISILSLLYMREA